MRYISVGVDVRFVQEGVHIIEVVSVYKTVLRLRIDFPVVLNFFF